MRENRQSGSEGREARKRAFLTPIRRATRVLGGRSFLTAALREANTVRYEKMFRRPSSFAAKLRVAKTLMPSPTSPTPADASAPPSASPLENPL